MRYGDTLNISGSERASEIFSDEMTGNYKQVPGRSLTGVSLLEILAVWWQKKLNLMELFHICKNEQTINHAII